MPRLFLGTWFLSFERFSRREGNGLDLVSIQISEKGAAIVGIVVFTNAGLALVDCNNGGFVELPYCLSVGG